MFVSEIGSHCVTQTGPKHTVLFAASECWNSRRPFLVHIVKAPLLSVDYVLVLGMHMFIYTGLLFSYCRAREMCLDPEDICFPFLPQAGHVCVCTGSDPRSRGLSACLSCRSRVHPAVPTASLPCLCLLTFRVLAPVGFLCLSAVVKRQGRLCQQTRGREGPHG